MAHFIAGHHLAAKAFPHLFSSAAHHHNVGHFLSHAGINPHVPPPISTVPTVGAHSLAHRGLGLLGNYHGYAATNAAAIPHHSNCSLINQQGTVDQGSQHHCTCAANPSHGSVASSGGHGHKLVRAQHQTNQPSSSYPLYGLFYQNKDQESIYEPLQRCFHIMQSSENKVVMYGGYFDVKIPNREVSLEILTTLVHIYDPYTEMWTSNTVEGERLPVGCGDAASALLGSDLYIYGATDQQGNTTNSLCKLDTETMKWHKVLQNNPGGGPINLSGCAMIAFGKKLGVFGGVRTLPNGKSRLAMEPNHDITDCSNELYTFDTFTNQWALAATSGSKPQPRYHFTFTPVGPSKVVLFGGYVPGYGLTNSVFVFHTSSKRWEYIQGFKQNHCPVPRNKHAACCLNYGSEHPQLFMTGGATRATVLNDSWMFDVTLKIWQQIPTFLTPRNGHSLAAVTLCPGVVEVLAFGGCSKVWIGVEDRQPKMAWTATYVFENYRNNWNLRSQANFKSLGDTERVADKEMLYRIKQGLKRNRREDCLKSQIHQLRKTLDNKTKELEKKLVCLQEQESIENRRVYKVEEMLQQQRSIFQEKRNKILAETMHKTEDLSKNEERVLAKTHELENESEKILDAELRLTREKIRTGRATERKQQLENEIETILTELKNTEMRTDELTIRINDLVKVTEAMPKTLQEKDLIKAITCANSERIRRARERADNAERMKVDTEKEVESATSRARIVEEKLRFAQNLSLAMMEQADRRVASAERNMQVLASREAEVKVQLKLVTEVEEELEEQLNRMEQQLLQKESERVRVVESLHSAEQEEGETLHRLRQAERRIAELQESLHERERRKLDTRGAIEQDNVQTQTQTTFINVNIEITNQTLGRGGWAEVNIARLRAMAKIINIPQTSNCLQAIQCDLNKMARVCHPNLQRFLGAVIQGNTVTMLNEFMATSLSAELERRRHEHQQSLPEEHITEISLNVAHALNYLHHMTPDPIIHRDLSSANVLLQPTPDGGWLAKVSDYGTANFQSRLQTENPGSPVYTAPESRDPALQTPKMDIYSFGVLLVEMCMCELPDADHLHALIRTIEWPNLAELAQQCIDLDMNIRPSAEQLLLLIPYTYR